MGWAESKLICSPASGAGVSDCSGRANPREGTKLSAEWVIWLEVIERSRTASSSLQFLLFPSVYYAEFSGQSLAGKIYSFVHGGWLKGEKKPSSLFLPSVAWGKKPVRAGETGPKQPEHKALNIHAWNMISAGLFLFGFPNSVLIALSVLSFLAFPLSLMVVPLSSKGSLLHLLFWALHSCFSSSTFPDPLLLFAVWRFQILSPGWLTCHWEHCSKGQAAIPNNGWR